MQKFQHFSVTQILRETNFEESRSEKSGIFAILEALKFDFYWFLHFLKAKIDKIDSLKNGKNSKFGTSTFSKIGFT